ncbi:MAG: hypothetical protein HYX57_12075 [Chloroflexi bacterium]|nr:hypothetical protein [Chloroflexota bacterium]
MPLGEAPAGELGGLQGDLLHEAGAAGCAQQSAVTAARLLGAAMAP